MKSFNNEEQQNDTVAAIGIGAMIVFIALILVAAVAAAVIIQTAEQLQQNAQKTGEDTADNMAGKVMINSVYVDANAAGEDYLLYVRLAPGSEATTTTTISYQVFCANGVAEGVLLGADVAPMTTGTFGTATMAASTGYIMTIDGNNGGTDCSPDATSGGTPISTAQLFIHVGKGGTTYETLTIDSSTAGSKIV